MSVAASGSYRSLVQRHWRTLGFGALLMAMSSFGQTFFIALFGARIRGDFGLSDGDFGTVYAVATIASAATMAWVGRLVDQVTTRVFCAAVAGVLCVACLLLAWSPGVSVLLLSLFLLRIAGQGLMVHTALTTVARALPQDRGKAIGLSALGLALGEAAFPIAAVWGMAWLDWRPVWVVNGSLVLLGAAAALALAPRGLPGAPVWRASATGTGTVDGAARLALWRDPRFARAFPLLLCSPFLSTGVFFHQARLAQEKAWDLHVVASWFVAYALARAASLLLVGSLLDRRSAGRTLPLLAIPLALAALVVAVVRQPWGIPLYMLLFGVAAATSSTLGTALWAEVFGAHRLGRVRALTEGGNVLASGMAPAAMGWMIDFGVPLSNQALAMTVLVAVAGWCARWRPAVGGTAKATTR